MTDGMIKGKLSNSLANLNIQTGLDLTGWKLVGTIPDFLYNHAQIEYLVLDDNNFTGVIPPFLPSSLETSPQLNIFQVTDSKLTGLILILLGQS